MKHRQADHSSVHRDPNRPERKRGSLRAGFIAPDELKQLLLKYINRHAKTGRDFALISIELANFETLSTYASPEDIKHMMNSVRAIVSRTARDADRIAMISPAMFLLLLPETSLDGADQALARFKQELSNKTRPIAQIKPVFNFRASASDTGGEAQELLSLAGCILDEHGELVTKAQTRSTSLLGSMESWHKRFQDIERLATDDTEILAQDTWTNQLVRIAMVKLPRVLDDSSSLEQNAEHKQLLQRARALQQMESQPIQKLVDFFVANESELFLVLEDEEPLQLADCLPTLSDLQLMQLCVDFAGALIQAHSLVPQMVLSVKPDQLRFNPGSSRLQICQIHINYLFPQVARSSTEDTSLVVFANFLDYIIQTSLRTDGEIHMLKELAEQVKQKQRPEQLNTLHKIRNHLRKLTDRLEAQRQAKTDESARRQ